MARLTDAFVPGLSWLQQAAQTVSDASPQTLADEFASEHVLTGVTAAGAGGFASVDGRQLQPGEQLNGFAPISISGRSATFESDGVQVVPELTVPAGADETNRIKRWRR